MTREVHTFCRMTSYYYVQEENLNTTCLWHATILRNVDAASLEDFMTKENLFCLPRLTWLPYFEAWIKVNSKLILKAWKPFKFQRCFLRYLKCFVLDFMHQSPKRNECIKGNVFCILGPSASIRPCLTHLNGRHFFSNFRPSAFSTFQVVCIAYKVAQKDFIVYFQCFFSLWLWSEFQLNKVNRLNPYSKSKSIFTFCEILKILFGLKTSSTKWLFD